jgi:hypothetical protein
LLRSLALAVVLALTAHSGVNAGDDDILILNVRPGQLIQAAPAPAQPAVAKPANPAAKPKVAAKISWLDRPMLFPTLLPNPLAFNVTWISTTNRKFAEARSLAMKNRIAADRTAIVRKRVVPNAAAQVQQNAIEQQMRKFLEPMLTTELSFAARTMDLNREERRKLAADGKAWFNKFIVGYVANQDPQQQQMLLQGMQGVWFGNQQRRPENPRDSIRAGVAKVVKDTQSIVKAGAYADECRKRDEFARQASVDNMVERIDEKVKLSPDQWKKLAKVLSDHWDKNRDPQVEALAMNTSMWPGTPLQWVLPELSPSQQAVLKRVNTMSTRIVINGGVFAQMNGGNGDVFDDINDEADADAAKPADEAAELHSEAE